MASYNEHGDNRVHEASPVRHKVFGRNSVAIRSFENHEEATGYALHYTACSGEPSVMMADERSSKVSLVCIRDQGWKVTVERFGTASDASNAYDRHLIAERGSRGWGPAYARATT